MTTVYGGSVPPGLTAPTRGELKIRIERMQLHQERLVEVPQLRPFLKSKKDTNRTAEAAPSDGQAVGDNDVNGVTNDPMELKNLLNTLEDMFAIAPLFWGEERHLAECKEPLTDRTVGIRPASTTIICPVKTLQAQFSQYLSHSAMSPLKGLPLHLLIPTAKSGKKTPIIVGAATLNIVAISPATPISGWFSIIGTSDRGGELIAIGRVKVHVSVNFYLSGGSSGGGGGGSSTTGGAKVTSGASTSTSEPGATLSGAGSAASSTADTAHLNNGNNMHTTTVGGAQPPVGSSTSNLSSSSLSENDWAEGASGAVDRQGQSQAGGPDVGRPPLHRHTPPVPHPLTSASEKSLRRQQQKILQQQQKLLLQQQQQHHQRLLVEESILAANKGRPSLLDPSPSSSLSYGLAEGSGALAAAGGLTAEQRRIIGEIALKGQRLKDELTLAAGRTEPLMAAGSSIGLDGGVGGGSSEGLGDLYRKHAPALLASAMGAAKGFTAMGVLGSDGPTGVEHRFLGGSGGGREGGFVLPPRDREDSLDSDLSHNDSFDEEDDDVEEKDRDHHRRRRNGNRRSRSRGSSSSSRSRGEEDSSSSLSSLSSSRSSSPHTNNRRKRTRKSRGKSKAAMAKRREFSSHLSEVYLTLSEFSFTEVVEEIRVQLRLSKDVSCPSPFDALSSFVYYLPPPTAATVSQRQRSQQQVEKEEEWSHKNPSIITIPLHFTVSSFTSESKLAIECYAVRSREVVLNDGSRTAKRGGGGEGIPQRVVESERLLGVVFVGLYTAAPRLVLFHDPLSGKNPVEAVAEVRVVRGSEHNSSPRSSSSPLHNMRARDANEADHQSIRQQQNIGSENSGVHQTAIIASNSPDSKEGLRRREANNHQIGFDSASFDQKGELISSIKKRGDGDKEERNSKRSANRRSSSSSSSASSREENARIDDRSKVVVYAAKGSSSTTTTATVTITNSSSNSSRQLANNNNSPLTRGAAGHEDERMIITRIDPQCPHHGLVATAEKERSLEMAKKEREAELKREAEREKEEAAEREAAARGGTRLHISLKQAKEIPNVQVVANPKHFYGESQKAGREGGGSSSHLLGASGIILVDPTSSSASNGSPARPPHAFLVMEDFVYCDPPQTASHGDQGGGTRASSNSSSGGNNNLPSASAAALISSLNAVRLPFASSAASTSFRDFIVRLEEKLSMEQGKEGATSSSLSSLSAEWSVDELSVVRGDFDRTLVSEASNKPQWNYESSVFIKGRGGAPSNTAEAPLVSGLIVSLWHCEPSASAAEEKEEEKSKQHERGAAKKNENKNTDESEEEEEERRFWSRASRIGTSFVDLRGLRYLSTVEGWYRCYSDHHCVDSTVGYLQLAVRKL